MALSSAPQAGLDPAASVAPGTLLDAGHLIGAAMRGRWTFEDNVYALLSGRQPGAAQAQLVRLLLLALSATPGPREDLAMVRLCASTGASLVEAVRPAIAGYAYLDRGAARADNPAGDYRSRCQQAMEQLATPAMRARACAALDQVCLEMLQQLDLAPAILPAFKIVARMPVLAQCYLEERHAWPNRYAGLKPAAGPDWPDAGAARLALSLMCEEASFVDLACLAMTGRRSEGRERMLVHAALVAGAAPVGAAASSTAMTLLAMRGAGFVEAYQGVLSTFGYYHLGALPECARMLWHMHESGLPLEQLVDEELGAAAWRAAGGQRGVRRVPGFGHRYFKQDPRALELLAVCQRVLDGPYIDLVARLNQLLGQRNIGHVNMDGMGAAMALHFGFHPQVVSGLTLISRTFGVAALFRNTEIKDEQCRLLVKTPKMERAGLSGTVRG